MSNLIFLLSLRPRSGTNFLQYILRQHPSVAVSCLYEDHMVSNLKSLQHFVEGFLNCQKEMGERISFDLVSRQLKSGFARTLENLIYENRQNLIIGPKQETDHQQKSIHQKIVSKSPSIEGISLLNEFFPNAKTLVLLRDPRDIIESEMLAFKREFRGLVLSWRSAAREFLDFLNSGNHEKTCYIVRYKELVMNTEPVVRQIFDFLELDSAIYNMTLALNAPVIGASKDMNREGWTIKQNTGEETFINKWRTWSRNRIDYFEATAGREAEALGFKVFDS